MGRKGEAVRLRVGCRRSLVVIDGTWWVMLDYNVLVFPTS